MPANQAEFWSEFLKRDVSFLSRDMEKRKADSFFSQLFEKNEEFVEQLRGGNVLEIGCGDGMDSVALALHYDCKVTAIDISESRVQLAIENIKAFNHEGRVSAMIGDANATDFPNNEFDGNSEVQFGGCCATMRTRHSTRQADFMRVQTR